MATVTDNVRSAPRPLRIGWTTAALAALATAAVAASAIVVLRTPATAPLPRDPAARTASIYTADERAVLRLVAEGVLPHEILDAEPFRTKALVAHGLVPRETLIPGIPALGISYCPKELAVLRAVAAGVVPEETLQGEPFRTRRLIARGELPPEAGPPC
jgi:hypothetical protein